MAVRIAGVLLPNEQRIAWSLPRIYGIGPALARRILGEIGVDPMKRSGELSEAELAKLRETIEKRFRVEGDLKREVLLNIKRLKEISSYRGIRHARNLPVRGQRTKTNSRTVRGNVRRTMGSGRAKAAEKT